MQTHARVDPGNTKGRGPTAPGVTTHLGGKAGALSFSQDRTSTDGLAIYPLAIIGTRLVTFFFFLRRMRLVPVQIPKRLCFKSDRTTQECGPGPAESLSIA